MALTNVTPTDIYVLLDESGSMQKFTALTRECVDTIMKGNIIPEIKYTVITFSTYVQSGNDLAKFKKPEHNSTRMFPAFKELYALIQKNISSTKKIVVVFVSDGEDSEYNQNHLEAKLKSMGALPTHSLFFTIGVGNKFPTTLVVDVLRPLYHKGSDTTPAVLPVINPEELHWTFGQLEYIILEEIYGSVSIPETIDETTSNKDLILYTQAIYNKCVNQCAKSGRDAKVNYTIMFESKTAINKVIEIAKARQNAERMKAPEQQFKPLLSVILDKKVNTPKACYTAALNAVTRLNKMLDDVSRGQLLSDLPDEAKKELLGRQYVEGKLTSTASKYRSADPSVTINSLKRLMENYKPNDQDARLEDSINLTTQAEYFEDASTHILDLLSQTHTIQGILKYLSFVCRTITLKTPVPKEALQMNEWLAEVCALPQLIPTMSTYDYYERQDESFTSRGETVNCLMVLGGDRNSPGIFHHVQSLLLLNHPGLFVITARLEMAGSVLFFLLGSHDTIHGWMHTEFKHVDNICRTYTRKSLENWHLYVESVTNPDFRICLVTESPKLPPQCKCPNLTKFVLALYVAATGGLDTKPYAFTLEELRERHFAVIVELLARARTQLIDCIDFDAQGSANDFIHDAWWSTMDGTTAGDGIMEMSLTLREAQLRFGTMVEWGLTSKSLTDGVLSSAKLTTQPIHAATYYQSSIERLDNVFHNLATICGHGNDVRFKLSDTELLCALKMANQFTSGYERFLNPEPLAPLACEDTQAQASEMAMSLFKRAVLGAVDTVSKNYYITHHKERHRGLANIIPAQHMERFKTEFGLDIARDWAVDPTTGLSKNACCSPKCSHYLELLNYNPQEVSTGICPRLAEHLMHGTNNQPMPAFHKTVFHSLKDAPGIVMDKIEAGVCLADPRPTAADKQWMEELKRDENGGDAMGFLQRCMETRVTEKKSKLIQAIRAHCEKAEEGTLEQEIITLQAEFTAPTWPYEDFREIFLSKYKKYPALHGDNPLFQQE
jgi:hypothetical protein